MGQASKSISSSELLKWKISQKEKLTAQVAKRALF
jgi:hypothetical protein